MWEVRYRIKETVDNNIVSINTYLKELTKQDSEQFFVGQDHIMSFYDFDAAKLKKILSEGKVPTSFPEMKLADLEGITKAMLILLKKRAGPRC